MHSHTFAPLIAAAREGDQQEILRLLASGIPVDQVDKEGKTALLHASFQGRFPYLVQLLLERGTTVDRKDAYGGTPLFWAVCGAHLDIVQMLLDHGADPMARDKEGRSPLSRAASGISRPAHIQILKLFIERGVDLDQADNHGLTPLINAAQGGYTEIVRLLLEQGANPNATTRFGETAIMLACRAYGKMDVEVVRLLREHGAVTSGVDGRGVSLLRNAARNGHAEIVELLLNAGLDINEELGAPLREACSEGQLSVVELLIRKGAHLELGEDGITPLMLALARHHNEIARLLIQAGAEVNAVTSSTSWGGARNVLMFALGIEDSLHYERSAPPKIDAELIRLLLARGADAGYTNAAGISPLSLARGKRNTRIIGMLKKKLAE